MQNTEKKQIQVEKATSKAENIISCPNCGHPISIFYFTKVKDVNGNYVYPKCQNCGYFDDPE